MTDLYRHYDNSGCLLYVGVSLNVFQRHKQHKVHAHWIDDVSRVDVEKFSSRQEALAAERLAIRTENPKHNLQRQKPQKTLKEGLADEPIELIDWKGAKVSKKFLETDFSWPLSDTHLEVLFLFWDSAPLKTNKQRLAAVQEKYPHFSMSEYYKLRTRYLEWVRKQNNAERVEAVKEHYPKFNQAAYYKFIRGRDGS